MSPTNDHTETAYAHSAPTNSCLSWEPLDKHLKLVATGCGEFPGAAGFAAKFDARDWGHLVAMWHDLGKYAPQFQGYLRRSAAGGPKERVDHSTAGALLAWRARGSHPLAAAIAFAIAGHHAGLADLGNAAETSESGNLLSRMTSPRPETSDALSAAPANLLSLPIPAPPSWLLANGDPTARSLRDSLFIRMLFSCLVDADRFATAAYANQASPPPVAAPISIADLAKALDQTIATLSNRRPGGPTPVDAVRATLLANCRDAAALAPGLFTLVAPTGAGKTLSSMAFALRHAQHHGLDRIIYALPFTSVTEQNAAVFRDAFASLHRDDIVLEHHSAYEPPKPAPNALSRADDSLSADARERQRLAATENWDAPVIVTTNVQLLESLFAAATTPCRKLHRIARSVHPIFTQEHAVTRCAVTTTKESENQSGGNRTMGRKFTLPYALYRTSLFINPLLADPDRHGTGFNDDDLDLVKEALSGMFDIDRSASRGVMSAVRCFAFRHDNPLGNARAADLFSRVTCQPVNGVAMTTEAAARGHRPPRSAADFIIAINEAKLPAGISVEQWL